MERKLVTDEHIDSAYDEFLQLTVGELDERVPIIIISRLDQRNISGTQNLTGMEYFREVGITFKLPKDTG